MLFEGYFVLLIWIVGYNKMFSPQLSENKFQVLYALGLYETLHIWTGLIYFKKEFHYKYLE